MTASLLSRADNILLSSIEGYVVKKEGIIDYVIGDKGVVSVSQDESGNYVVSALSLEGKTYVLFLKNDGSNFSHFFEVKNSRGLVKNQNEKMISGTLTGRTSFNKNISNVPYSFGLKSRIRTTENTSFMFGAESTENKETKEASYSLSFWELDYLNSYVNWMTFTEPSASVPYYLTNRFRGYSLGLKDKNYEFFVWKANQYNNNVEDPNYSAEGISARGSLSLFDYRFNLNHKDDRTIPLASTNFEVFKIYNGISYSLFENRQLFSYNSYKNFNENQDSFTLKSLSFYYAVAPNGTYSLSTQNENFNQKYNAEINFANEDHFNRENEKNIDTIPGIITTSLGYDSDNVNTFFLNKFRFFSAYGKSEKFTFSWLTEYGATVLDNARSESFLYSPRLSFYVVGNKSEGGYYVRNEYTSNINKNFFLNLTEDSRNTLGLFRNTKRYNYGLYIGDSRFYNGTNDNSSRILGASLFYFLKDNLSGEISYEKATNPSGSYGYSLSGQLRGYYNREFEVRGKIDYSQNYDSIKSIKRDNTKGSLGFIWNFDYENGDVYSKLESKNKTISGYVFNDLNFNGVKDEDEPLIEGAKLSIIKVGNNEQQSDNKGRFMFSGFSKDESATLKVEDSKMASGKEYVFNMKNSQEVQIPMYEFETRKVYFYSKNKKTSIVPVSFSCESKAPLKREIYTDYILVYFPKNQVCEPEVSDSGSNLMIVDFEKTNDSMIVNYQQIPKMISFSFDQKIKPIMLNGKKISNKNKDLVAEVEEFDGFLDIKVPEKCQIYPNMTAIPYISLKNQNFFKISCF